jgi:hypothetical protein
MRWLARLLGFGFWWLTKLGAIFVILDGTWTLGAALLLVVALAYAMDYLAGLLPEVLARRRAAAFFRDMAVHGKHQEIDLNFAVHIWMGKNPQTPMEVMQADFKIHHLKAAIGQGFLQAYGPGGSVKTTTLCRPADLADYFASWHWILVKDEKWKEAIYLGQSQ